MNYFLGHRWRQRRARGRLRGRAPATARASITRSPARPSSRRDLVPRRGDLRRHDVAALPERRARARARVGRPPRADSIQHAGLGTALNSSGRRGFFDGAIDEVRIWNVARTAQQIARPGSPARSRRDPDLLGRWGLNESSGSIVSDSSGRGINGTIVAWAGSGRKARRSTSSRTTRPTCRSSSPRRTGHRRRRRATLNVSVSRPDGDPMTVTYYGRDEGRRRAEDFTSCALRTRSTTSTTDPRGDVHGADELDRQQPGDAEHRLRLASRRHRRAPGLVRSSNGSARTPSLACSTANGFPYGDVARQPRLSTPAARANFYDQYFPPVAVPRPAVVRRLPRGGGRRTNRLNKDNYELFSWAASTS